MSKFHENSNKQVGFQKDQSSPQHIAIIMDGNGRWATNRTLPRTAGHQAGVAAVRKTVEYCARAGIRALTLFAFSSENWRRPQQEISVLMKLFLLTLERETEKLCKNGVRLKFIGDRSAFSPELQSKIADAEQMTRDGANLALTIAANYGGRWDILQAFQKLILLVEEGKLDVLKISEQSIESYLSFPDLPEPDLFIRTGGEQRISNFMLWQLAYTELYFTDTLWPDFDEKALQLAIEDYARRQRRFGFTGEQIEKKAGRNYSAHP